MDKKKIDKPKSNCGVTAIYGTPDAAHLAYLALYALQHRGQESAGIVSYDGKLHKQTGQGLVADVFSDQERFKQLKGTWAIGHNRYSTTGSTQALNAQPLTFNNYMMGPFAIAHNGNFTNSGIIRKQLEKTGSLFQTTTDTEIIPHLIARSDKETISERIIQALKQITGAYSLVMLTRDGIYAARDPHGVRPLCVGKQKNTYCVVSETCALDLLKAEFVREIQPGELIKIDENGITAFPFQTQQPRYSCIFEFIYFARPDSRIFNDNVDRVRRKLGKILALESDVEADIVISVPDSSNTAALGYSRRSNLKFELGLIRNHYVGRTFIHPSQNMRDFSVRVKFNAVKGILDGRRVVVVEDSIVRGTTLKQLVKHIRENGAKEVHLRVSSPPIVSPCFYGMDFPSKSELIANNKSIEDIKTYLDCDSLHYLSHKGLLESVKPHGCGFCTACFTGTYPIPIEDKIGKYQHEQNEA